MKTTSLITTVLRHSSNPSILLATGLTGGSEDPFLCHQLDIALPAGVSALVGDEGVGKTSLLRLLAGDLTAAHGKLSISGRNMALYAPQPALVFWCDLRLPLHDNDTPEACWDQLRQHLPDWSQEAQITLTDRLRLTPHLGKRLDMLSTGSRRKVGLIAALASGATVTLIDQAFASLDQSAIRVVEDVLQEASQHKSRAWLLADHEAPHHIPLSSVLTLNQVTT